MHPAFYPMPAPARVPGAPLSHQIADYLITLLPGSRPRRIARMLGPESADKYRDIPKQKPFTRAHLVDHAAGRATWAATLDQDGQASAGAIDIDQGGRPALMAALAAAAELGITAYAIAIQSEQGHNGGHLWCTFDRPYPAAHIAGLMRQITDRAQLGDAEIWPGNNHIRRADQVIRLPFGQHRKANTRGDLLLQSGEIVTLDRDLAAGLAALLELPHNSAPPAIAEPTPALNLPKSPRQLAPAGRPGLTSFDDVKAQFNAQHTLEQLLLEYGAQRAPGGYSCPCGVPHTHQVTLFISSRGRLFSFSERCKWYTEKGWDAFGLYVLVEHSNDPIAAVKVLNPIAPHQARQEAPTPAPEPSPGRTPAQIADAQRKRAKSLSDRASRMARIATLEALAAADKLCSFDRKLWAHHQQRWLELGSPEHYESNEGIARAVLSIDRAPTANELRRLQLAHGRLIARGYLVRTIRWKPGENNTNCWQPGAGAEGGMVIRSARAASAAQPEGITMLESCTDSQPLTLEASERAPAPQPPAPTADRGLLGYVRALAREAAEPGWALRDYAGFDQAQLEQEAGRLELLLRQAPIDVDEVAAKTENFSVLPPAELEPAAQLGAAAGASYSPPAIEPTGDYTGRSKDLAGFETLWRWSNAAIRMREDRSDQANGAGAEQQQPLEPAPSSAGLQACPPAPTDPRYREFAWRWNAAQQVWREDRQRAYFKRQALAFCDYAEPSEAERRWLAFKRSTTWARPPSSSRPPAPPTSRGRPAPIGRGGARAAPPSQAPEALQLGIFG